MEIFLLFIFNILFMSSLWHMDVHHNIELSGGKKTRGVFKMEPEKAYRVSQYFLIVSMVLIDILFLQK